MSDGFTGAYPGVAPVADPAAVEAANAAAAVVAAAATEAPAEPAAPTEPPPPVGTVVTYQVGDADPVYALVVGHTEGGHALVFSLAAVQGCASFPAEDLTVSDGVFHTGAGQA